MYEFDPDRIAKVRALEADGVRAWPAGYPVTHSTTAARAAGEAALATVPAEVRAALGADDAAPEARKAALDASNAALAGLGAELALAGRLLFKNEMGKAGFGRMLDGAGRVQFYVKKDVLGEDAFALWKKLDLGDIVGVKGGLMVTRTGELTVEVRELTLLSKCVRSLPDKFHGMSDPELRQRQRYVDLFVNDEHRETFRRRAEILRYVRRFFDERGYLEVETPMMHPIPGGATARPFSTHHNALDTELFLRVAPELYLKRLVVGGFERVYEINRSFRNEGIDQTHNPEFTMLEFYQAYATWKDLVVLTRELLVGLVRHVTGGTVIEYKGHTIDFAGLEREDCVKTYEALVSEATGLTGAAVRDPAALGAWWAARHPDRGALPASMGRAWEAIFEEHVEASLIQPTFVAGYPIEISPLARRNDDDPELADRFEIFVAGSELGNGFTELADPVDQAARFEAQARAKAGGDVEAMHYDADFIDALCYGLPPTAGQGLGIDRLVMMLTGNPSIREVILFPTLRPRATGS